MIGVNEIPQNRRQVSLMASFFFLTNGNVTFDDKMLKIPVEDLNEISEKSVQFLDDFGVQHITKAYPYCICTDAVMKPKLTRLVSCSGYWCCPLRKGDFPLSASIPVEALYYKQHIWRVVGVYYFLTKMRVLSHQFTSSKRNSPAQ